MDLKLLDQNLGSLDALAISDDSIPSIYLYLSPYFCTLALFGGSGDAEAEVKALGLQQSQPVATISGLLLQPQHCFF